MIETMKPTPISQTGKLRHDTISFLAQDCSALFWTQAYFQALSSTNCPGPLEEDPHRPTHTSILLWFAQGTACSRGTLAYVVMAQHHPFGVPCGARGIDEDRALVGLLAQDDAIQLHIGDGVTQLHEVMPLWTGRRVEGGNLDAYCLDPVLPSYPRGWERNAQDFHTQPPPQGLSAQSGLIFHTGMLGPLIGLAQEVTDCLAVLGFGQHLWSFYPDPLVYMLS